MAWNTVTDSHGTRTHKEPLTISGQDERPTFPLFPPHLFCDVREGMKNVWWKVFSLILVSLEKNTMYLKASERPTMPCLPNRAEPILLRIKEDRTRIISPSFDNIKYDTFEIEEYPLSAQGFDWELWCRYLNPPKTWWTQHNHTAPIRLLSAKTLTINCCLLLFHWHCFCWHWETHMLFSLWFW